MKKKIVRWILPVCMMLLLAGCGKSSNTVVTGTYYNPSKDAENTAQTVGTEADANDVLDAMEQGTEQEGTSIGADLFLITNNDMQAECLILTQLNSGKQYMYNYTIATRLLDKYGSRMPVSGFDAGSIIRVGEKDKQGRLVEAQISDLAWEYPDVTRYSVDEEHGAFKIADTNYSYDEDLFVVSDGSPLQLSDLTALDTLRVVGIDKKIYSISVTTGHGSLKLVNTSVFDGSYIQVGSKVFAQITGEMTIEIPEGTYTAAVANNGYGGSTEITITRGQETVLDLETLKGEGPKYGSILFAVNVEGAWLQVDGQLVDYSQPVELQYGVHTLTVTADGYDTYSKKLFVNSPEATIAIGMTGESGSSSTTTGSETQSSEADSSTSTGESADGQAGSLAGSLAGSHSDSSPTGSSSSSSSGSSSTSTGTSDTTSDAALDAIVNEILDDDGESTKSSNSSSSDYLSTLTELLKAIKGS